MNEGPLKPENTVQTAMRAQGFKKAYNNVDRLPYRIVKRAFDIVFSSAVIAVGDIPGAIISVAIMKDTGGNPIYAQEQVGWSMIGQKSGAASGYIFKPALSALKTRGACHPRHRLGAAA